MNLENSKLQQYQQQQWTPNAAMGQVNVASTSLPEGILSSMQALAQEVSESMALAENLRSSLGISCPKDVANQSGPPPSALFEIIRKMTSQIRNANSDFAAVLQHLNS